MRHGFKIPIFENQIKKGREKIILELGIYSLSRIRNDILMWSHYADSHKGFCIQFLDDPKDRFIARAQSVSYSEDYPIVNPITETDAIRLEKSLLTKAKHWEYEDEWRIIDHEKGHGIKKFSPHLLVGIIFGCRMNEGHKEMIRRWCENQKLAVSFYQAREAPRTYSLDIIKL